MRLRALVVFVAFSVAVCALQAQTNNPGLSAPELFEKGMNALEGSTASQSGGNAIDYFRRSAELGFAPAQTVLGYLYETGRYTTTDPQQALEWYKKASQQDDSLAQWLAGRLIYLGTPMRDLNESASWLEKSGNHDDPFAQYLLGKVFLDRGDYGRAAASFGKAAMQGMPQAQRHLAFLLRDGQGVPVDKAEAYVWLLASYHSGVRSVAPELQALESELGSQQLQQAKTRARDLEGKTARGVVGHGCAGWRGEFDEVPAPPPPDLQRFCR
jgi:uncharacterized protein